MVCTIIVVWLLLLLRVLGQNMIALCNIALLSIVNCVHSSHRTVHTSPLGNALSKGKHIYIYIQPEYNAFSCWKLCIWQMKALLARKGTVDGMPCFQTTQARNGLYIYFLRNYCRSFVCNQSYKSRDEGEKKTHFLSGNGPCVEV